MKKQNNKLRFWLLYHIGMIAFSTVASLLMKYLQTGNALHPTVIVVIVTIFLISAGIGYLAIFMLNKAKGYNQAQINKRILPALLLFYAIAYLIAILSISIGVLAWFLYMGRDISEFWSHLINNELNFSNGRFLIWLMFFTIAFFYVLWQKTVKKEQKLREENLRYKYQNLKSQVNPHFLFNSLNTLSELVYEDAERADRYIQKLSAIYRYILENEETDLIPLKQELEFVKQYFDLQKECDNGKIILELELNNTENYRIIPVSLQLLVENVLKHNTISQNNPLKIRIYFEDDCVIVSNSIHRKNILEKSTKTGLLNLKERVNLTIGRSLEVSEENNQFIVKLPIVQVQK